MIYMQIHSNILHLRANVFKYFSTYDIFTNKVTKISQVSYSQRKLKRNMNNNIKQRRVTSLQQIHREIFTYIGSHILSNGENKVYSHSCSP